MLFGKPKKDKSMAKPLTIKERSKKRTRTFICWARAWEC